MACGMKVKRKSEGAQRAGMNARADCTPPFAPLLDLARRLIGQAFVGPC